MSYFGLVTRDAPLVVFAYIGTAIVAGLAVMVAVALMSSDKTTGATFVQWWRMRSEYTQRVWRERAFRRDHS